MTLSVSENSFVRLIAAMIHNHSLSVYRRSIIEITKHSKKFRVILLIYLPLETRGALKVDKFWAITRENIHIESYYTMFEY